MSGRSYDVLNSVDHNKDLDALLQLQPRIVTRTSPDADHSGGQDLPPDVLACMRKQKSPDALEKYKSVWIDSIKYKVVSTKMDGQCFYRAASMHRAGTFDDDDLRSYDLRCKVAAYAETEWFGKATGREMRELRMQIWMEMQEDRVWVEQHGTKAAKDMDMKAYFEYLLVRSTFATFFMVAAFVKFSGVGAEVYQRGYGGAVRKVWSEIGRREGQYPLRVLYENLHYDLLVKDDVSGATNASAAGSPAKKQKGGGDGAPITKKHPAAV